MPRSIRPEHSLTWSAGCEDGAICHQGPAVSADDGKSWGHPVITGVSQIGFEIGFARRVQNDDDSRRNPRIAMSIIRPRW
jgi:hypothetical protein